MDGTFDLPIIRDSLGYPYVLGTQVKGTLKSLLVRKLGCLKDDGKVNYDYTCSCLYCLLGAGVGGDDVSALQVTNLYQLLIPRA